MSGWRLEHTYSHLPALFHAPAAPTPVSAPEFVVFNTALATSLGLDARALDSQEGAALFAGNILPENARPLAQAYAGHQFGHFTALGDGRAILLGEQITPESIRVDIQLKGPGRTPYSRNGDGRAAVGPMLRELIVSEAMHALGIPTSRSLAVVSTGEPVYREQVLPGAVLTRVASSHIRVGTFQWATAHRDLSALRALADYTIQRHYPDVSGATHPYLALLDAICDRQASLVAQWQLVGFVHGVMNTDNMSIAGETIDYGPCAFMDSYDPSTVFSSIDVQGRYAYGRQPAIAQWNLARLAEAMLPLLDTSEARAVELASGALARFTEAFDRYWLAGMRPRLGLFSAGEDDAALIDALLVWMLDSQADYTNTFRMLNTPHEAEAIVNTDAAFRVWHARWRSRLGCQPQSTDDVNALMRRHSPAVIPRNHKVEEALTAASDHGELEPLNALLSVLAAPYDYSRLREEFVRPAPPGGRAYRTFCGT